MKNFTIVLATVFLFLILPAAHAQNRALNFDGLNDRIIVPPASQYDFEYGTVELWVRPQGLVGNTCLIANRSYGGTRWSFHMSPTQIGLYNGAFYSAINYSSTGGVWYHVAFVCDPYETEIFVNGNSIGYTTNVVMGYQYYEGEYEGITGQELSIGSVRDNGGSYEHFVGDMDDIRIWDQKRTQQQISDYRNSTLTGTEPGLVALFNFDQGISSGNNTAISTVTESVMLNDGWLNNFAMNGSLSNFIPRFTALPITLTEFKSTRENDRVSLYWSTSTEQNSHSFIIERSGDGNNFIAIGNKPAAGGSHNKKSYRYEDHAPLGGNNYYRLKLIDADGKYSYSDTRSVNFSIDAKLSWYTQGNSAVVQLSGGGNEQYTISDMNGVVAALGRLQNGKLLITGRPAGIYTVRIWTEAGVKSIKIMAR